MTYSNKSREELIQLCKEKNIKNYSKCKKHEIIKLLETNHVEPSNHVTAPLTATTPTAPTPTTAPTTATTPSFIEVCSGCGGLSTGFINVGFTPVLLNEIHKTFSATLKKNHPGVKVETLDMQKLDLKSYKNKVDILMGGVPCQAFSQAGERKGLEDPRGKLIVEFNRLVNEVTPKIMMVENVKGLTTHKNGETLKSIIKLFENNGKYKIYTKVLNSKDYDVPQKRERIFIIGVRTDFTDNQFIYPTKSATPVLLKDVLVNVPPSPGIEYSEAKRKVMELVPQGGCWVDLPEDIQKEFMGEKSLAAGGGKRGMARRLAMNEQSLTLTTSPSQKQTERCHPLETRPLTVREYARIQTFPDSYIFEGGVGNQYKQIGNAVPVKLAEAMARQIKLFLSEGSQMS